MNVLAYSFKLLHKPWMCAVVVQIVCLFQKVHCLAAFIGMGRHHPEETRIGGDDRHTPLSYERFSSVKALRVFFSHDTQHQKSTEVPIPAEFWNTQDQRPTQVSLAARSTIPYSNSIRRSPARV